MPDLRRIVDEIRFYLDSNEAEMTDSVREAGEEYAEVCRQANQRLRRCGDFLNRNLRSEAIQLAEAEPDLLEVVSTLDFAGRENWDQVVSLYSLTPVEPLLIDVAEALNEAYALQQPVKKLLDKHRFLALSRAPFKQRLAVLWKLVEHDPSLGTWEADACEMERARLREIEAEARDAVKRVDAQGMNAIVEELQEGKWIESIPQNFKSGIAQSAQEITRLDARGKVEDIATAMQAVLAESNIAQARQLKTAWEHYQDLAGLDGFDPVSLRAQPTLRWLAEQDAKEAARQKWEQALVAFSQALGNEQATRSELERARAALLRINPAIPPPLEERFRDRVRQIERREKLRRFSIIGASTAAVLAVVGLSALLVWRSLRNAEVGRLSQTLTQMVGEGKLIEARKFADKQSDVAQGAQWQAAVQTLTDAEEQEARRTSEFAALIAAALKDGTYAEARTKLESAARLAKTAEEKSEVDRTTGQWEARHNRERLAKQTEIQERIDAITADLRRAQSMRTSAAPATDVNALLAQIGERLGALEESVRGSEGDYGARVAVLKTELKGLQDSALSDSRKTAALEAIDKDSLIQPTEADSAKQVDNYIAALATFTQAFPDDPRTPDFQDVRKEASVYGGICAWQNLVGQWKVLTPRDAADLRKRVTDCADFVKKNPQSPLYPIARQYSAFLEAMLRREEGEGGNKSEGIITRLHDLFAGPLMQNVHVLWDNEGNAYYLKGAVDVSGKEFANLHFLIGFRGEEKNRNIPTRDLKKAVSEPAPQSGLSAKALEELGRLSLDNWEPAIAHLSRLILDTQNLDPFLKYALLRYVLEYGAAGSDGLNAELQEPLKTLHNGLDLSTRWMVPNDPAAKKARPEAAQVLIRIGDLDKAWSQAERRREQLARALFCRCLFVGRLARSSEGEWTCRTRWSPDGSYELLVAVPGSNSEPSRLEPIGAVKEGRVTVSRQERATVLREGRLILARAPSVEHVAVTGTASEISK